MFIIVQSPLYPQPSSNATLIVSSLQYTPLEPPTPPFYNGQYLANSQDTIVVTLNFRIDVFGLSGAPKTAQNVGLLDQRLAV